MPSSQNPFPAWAPAELVRDCIQRTRFLEHAWDAEDGDWTVRDLQILRALLTDLRMREVWGYLSKLPAWTPALNEELVRIASLAVVEFDARHHRARRENERHHQAIAAKAGELRALVEENAHSFPPLGCSIDGWHLARWLKRRGYAETRAIASAVRDYFEAASLPYAPTFADALADLERRAIEHSQAMPEVGKPNGERAAAFWTALRVHRFFLRTIYQPLHKQVAMITSVATGIAIEQDDVRLFTRSKSRTGTGRN